MDGLGRVLHHHLRGFQVAQACTGHQGVLHVVVEGVGWVHHGGNATLRPAAGTVGQLPFGQHRNALRGRQLQCGGQPGQAAAHDHDVKMLGVCHGVFGSCQPNGVKRQVPIQFGI